jgi:hypothetical protein
MNTKQKADTGPVPFEKHYDVFKHVEQEVKDHLSGLDHEYFVAGMRVAYDEMDSSSEPGIFPHSVEFGYLGPVDADLQCKEPQEISKDELQQVFKNTPIPVALLDHFYAYSKETLDALADAPLKIGIAIVLTGSSTEPYSVGCYCSKRTRLKYCYYDKKTKTTKCYCTKEDC